MMLKSELYIKLERIEIHPCRVCPKAFTSLEEFNQHIAKHDPSNINLNDRKVLDHILNAYVLLDRSKSFQCEHCGEYFQDCRAYKLHKLTHIQQAANIKLKASKDKYYDEGSFIKLYKCSECDLRFVAQSTLIAHAAAHEPLRYICHCGVGYYVENDLKAHKKLVHPDYKEPIPEPEPEMILVKPDIVKTKIAKYTKSKITKLKKQKKYEKSFTTTTPNEDDVLLQCTDKNMFVCPVCKKELSSKASVKVHLRTHTGEKPYPCKICGKYFSQSPALAIHMKRHEGIKDFICNYCNKGFYSKGALNLHLRVHTKEKPYTCKYCDKPFSDPSAMARHNRTHTGHKPYQCPLCPKNFSDASALIVHRRRHANYKPEKCHRCHKKFANKDLLKKHIRVMHTEIKDFECPECGRKFALKQYLQLHMYVRHMTMVNKCSRCKEVFEDRSALIVHCGDRHNCEECRTGSPSDSHVEEHIYSKFGTRFECDYCGADFTLKSYLVVHMVSRHSTESCISCSMRFMSKTELFRHREKGCLTCKICKRTFANREKLADHVILHPRRSKPRRREIKFTCDECGQGFLFKNSLVTHIHRTHMVLLYCSVCSARFYSDEKFQRHKLKGCKQLKCEICGKVYMRKKFLENHLEVHSGKRHGCNLCDQNFIDIDNFRNHMILKHGV